MANQTNQNRSATRRSEGGAGNFLLQVERERHGVTTTEAEALRRALALSVDRYAPLLGMKPSAYKRYRARRTKIKGAPGYAIGDLESMLCKIDGLVSTDVDDFNAARWFSEWIELPQPALGGLTPAVLLDTPAGRQLVARLLGAMGEWRLPVTHANSFLASQKAHQNLTSNFRRCEGIDQLCSEPSCAVQNFSGQLNRIRASNAQHFPRPTSGATGKCAYL